MVVRVVLRLGIDAVLCGGAERVVEFLAEDAHQWALQELIGAYSLAAAFLEGVTTDFPFVEVQRHPSALEAFDPDRVQRAGLGLAAAALLYGAKA